MQSCRGREFCPVFSTRCGSSSSSSSEEESSNASESDSEDEDEDDQPRIKLSKFEKAFADAKDRWKIDNGSMKGFYLHSESGRFFCWDQPKGILYEYERESGECTAIWASKIPQMNAEIWTVLPLPPTDPASLQQGAASSGKVLCMLNARFGEQTASMRVPATGAILGSCVPEINALTGYDPDLAQAHCKVMCRSHGAYAVSDLGASKAGTLHNGKKLEPRCWSELSHGDELRLGVLTVRVQLQAVHGAQPPSPPLPGTESPPLPGTDRIAGAAFATQEDSSSSANKSAAPKKGGWREAKRRKTNAAQSDTADA